MPSTRFTGGVGGNIYRERVFYSLCKCVIFPLADTRRNRLAFRRLSYAKLDRYRSSFDRHDVANALCVVRLSERVRTKIKRLCAYDDSCGLADFNSILPAVLAKRNENWRYPRPDRMKNIIVLGHH